MNFPTYASIVIRKTLKVELNNSDREFLEREGFSEDEVNNWIESQIRDAIFEYINENDIKISLI